MNFLYVDIGLAFFLNFLCFLLRKGELSSLDCSIGAESEFV